MRIAKCSRGNDFSKIGAFGGGAGGNLTAATKRSVFEFVVIAILPKKRYVVFLNADAGLST